MSRGVISFGEFCEELGLPLSAAQEAAQLILDRDRARATAADAQMEGWGSGRWQSTSLRDGREDFGPGVEARLPKTTVLNHLLKKDAEIRREADAMVMMEPEYLDWLLKKAPGARVKYVPRKVMVGYRGAPRTVVKRYGDGDRKDGKDER